MLASMLKILGGEPAEEVVWTADISYWIAGRRQDGTARPQWATEEGYLALHRELGVLPYYYYDKFWVAEASYGDDVELVESSHGNRHLRRFCTPVGEIVEEATFSPISCSLGCTKHLVESEADLDVLRYVIEHRRLLPVNLDDYPQRRQLWEAYDGLPCLGLPRSPLAAICCEWAGVENMTYLLADCHDKMVQLLQMMEEQEAAVLEAVCEAAPPLVHFPDNLTSENLTGFYDPYMAGPHQRRIERLRAAGVKSAVHLDGTVRGLLPKLIRSGFDAVEAITPKPAGDLELEQIDELAGDAPVIPWGGVPGVLFAPPFTWEEVAAHVRRVLDCWGRRPFILGVADQVPPDGRIEFCRKISQLVQSRA